MAGATDGKPPSPWVLLTLQMESAPDYGRVERALRAYHERRQDKHAGDQRFDFDRVYAEARGDPLFHALIEKELEDEEVRIAAVLNRFREEPAEAREPAAKVEPAEKKEPAEQREEENRSVTGFARIRQWVRRIAARMRR
jgi:hypothetical protein